MRRFKVKRGQAFSEHRLTRKSHRLTCHTGSDLLNGRKGQMERQKRFPDKPRLSFISTVRPREHCQPHLLSSGPLPGFAGSGVVAFLRDHPGFNRSRGICSLGVGAPSRRAGMFVAGSDILRRGQGSGNRSSFSFGVCSFVSACWLERIGC